MMAGPGQSCHASPVVPGEDHSGGWHRLWRAAPRRRFWHVSPEARERPVIYRRETIGRKPGALVGDALEVYGCLDFVAWLVRQRVAMEVFAKQTAG